MNAHQTYVANVIENLTAAEVAALVAQPPGNRAAVGGADKIHEMVMAHATDETMVTWAELLAEAASTKREEAWAPTWALPIAAMIFDIDMPEEAEQDGEPDGAPASVSTIGHAAEAAAEAA